MPSHLDNLTKQETVFTGRTDECPPILHTIDLYNFDSTRKILAFNELQSAIIRLSYDRHLSLKEQLELLERAVLVAKRDIHLYNS